MFFGNDFAFQCQEIVHIRAVGMLDEENPACYRVTVVVETEVKPFSILGKSYMGSCR